MVRRRILKRSIVTANTSVGRFKFSSRVLRFLASCKHRIILCHWFVAKTSKYRERLLVALNFQAVGLNFQAVGLNFQAVFYTRSDCTQSDTDIFVLTCR